MQLRYKLRESVLSFVLFKLYQEWFFLFVFFFWLFQRMHHSWPCQMLAFVAALVMIHRQALTASLGLLVVPDIDF